MLVLIYLLKFHMQLILIIPGEKTLNTLIVPSWKNNFGKKIILLQGKQVMEKSYQMIYFININQRPCTFLKKFWLFYNVLYNILCVLQLCSFLLHF